MKIFIIQSLQYFTKFFSPAQYFSKVNAENELRYFFIKPVTLSFSQ